MVKKISFKAIYQILSEKSCFIFDLDNTLINLNTDWIKIKKNLKNFAKKKLNENISFESLVSLKIIKDNYDEKVLFDFHKIIEKEEHLSVKYNAEKNLNGFRFFDKICSNFIKKTDSSNLLAILSNNFHSTIRLALEKFNIEEKIDIIIGRDDLSNLKPDPEGLNEIFTKIPRLQKSQMVFFGDSINDKIAAERFLIDFFYISSIKI